MNPSPVKQGILFISFLIYNLYSVAQQEHKPTIPDTTTLGYALRKGSKVDLHLRAYYMTTNNEQPLSNYYAYAFGGGLKYETGIFKGFQFTVGGFFVWNLASSDLTEADPTTGTFSRYEVGQFDMEDFSNKNDLDRLEDFNIKYHFRQLSIVFGKQAINTPFINPQDGRMRPTGEEGLWLDIKEIKKTRIQAGWLTKVSPRGTVRWFSVDESIGIYPSGFSTTGGRSNYKGNLESLGVGVLGLTYTIRPGWTLQGWDYFTEGIFNTLMVQSDAEWKLGARTDLVTGLQYTRQNALGTGGNADLSKTYFDPRQKANIISARAGLKVENWRMLMNYTRITADGRFLFPREWGREPMYTFMKRERNEGLGDVNAYTVSVNRDIGKAIKAELAYGYYNLPALSNLALNKYGMPSYHQFLLDMNYRFPGFLKGLQMEFLYTYKLEAADVVSKRAIINKVNMHHVNVILNYHL